MNGRALGSGWWRFLAVACVVLTASVAVGAQSEGEVVHEDLIPVEKDLSEEMIERLYERGEPIVYSGEELKTIGMPVGGVAAGQMYLRGDGTLAEWAIFNKHVNTGYGADCYRTFRPKSPVDSGFAVVVERDGERMTRKLNRDDFPGVTFRGEYPIATVTYASDDFPVEVTMEAFSPFIPLNAEDSGLPATVFHLTVKNTSGEPLRAGLVGWLENAVCFHTAKFLTDLRHTEVVDRGGRSMVVHTARKGEKQEREPRRMVFEDFEGEDYGEWKATGRAFGEGPAGGTLGGQQEVSGFQGDGLVNTFIDGDEPQGTLTSPEFEVKRKFINFLIGGGAHDKRTCMNLLVGGEVVRTATGKNNERLEWRFWEVREFVGQQARLQIVDKHSEGWGHINIDQIEFADVPRSAPGGPLEEQMDYGSMALALDGRRTRGSAGVEMIKAVDEDLLASDESTYPIGDSKSTGLASRAVELDAGEAQTSTFVLSWYFANHSRGHNYANLFDDAPDVAGYVLDENDRLTADTRLWRDTFYRDGNLPWWLLFRLHSTVANLCTNTCQWWGSGRFWAWEGVGCCAGTCTHVWNYQHAVGRLFPSLARNIRHQQDFGEGFDPESGLVGFRSNRAYAADGQCGTVLKAYREHLMSADSEFLEEHWPRIKMAMQFSIDRDGDGNGLLEGSQHNTFDVNFFGPNTFVGSLYLASLRAAEEMAREVGDEEFAERCHRIFERGREASVEKLWNGEYFIQQVDVEKHPRHQYATGCMSDQMFGQNWAHQVGLGYIYPEDKVEGALEAVWEYNWAPDVGPYNEVRPPFRVYAVEGEPGLFTCTWPRGGYLPNGVRYKNEIWTGIEYQAAGGMVWEDMVREALVICHGVHERYDPVKHNPYNEVECGEHYARAMASWGVYTALAGYDYDGPDGYMAFAPRMQEDDFRAAFTAAQGWGLFTQQREDGRQHNRIEVRWGTLRLKKLQFALPEGTDSASVKVTVEGESAEADTSVEDGTVRIELAEDLVLHEGQAVEVSAR